MIYMMMILQALLTAKVLNLAFAALCVWGAFGLHPKTLALLSALLCFALAFT
ncbi:MAG: hypothetical protein COB08_013490 [Rhodobacteraceae bacterium]|nr:hypothetical protein [Paracoccaceae bacterium]